MPVGVASPSVSEGAGGVGAVADGEVASPVPPVVERLSSSRRAVVGVTGRLEVASSGRWERACGT
jgi:hypothetical protein